MKIIDFILHSFVVPEWKKLYADRFYSNFDFNTIVKRNGLILYIRVFFIIG